MHLLRRKAAHNTYKDKQLKNYKTEICTQTGNYAVGHKKEPTYFSP